MSNDMVKRLAWSGLLAGIGALTTIVANRIATAIWVRIFDIVPQTDEEFERAKSLVVEAICSGLEAEPARGLSAVSG